MATFAMSWRQQEGQGHLDPLTPLVGAGGAATGPCCVGSSAGRVAYSSQAARAMAPRAIPRYIRSLLPIAHSFGAALAMPAAGRRPSGGTMCAVGTLFRIPPSALGDRCGLQHHVEVTVNESEQAA
jgi:hypothetical protein